jgi:DNA helicase-2/ATP-dependent DNA helicase PcrA
MNLEDLNEHQRAAATAQETNVVVLAGPAAGKTKTLVTRIEYLQRKMMATPDSIVAITFTNQAAREMEKRLIGTVQHGPDCETTEFLKLGHCGTLHSFALRMLREYGAARGYGTRTAMVSPESTRDLLEAQAKRYNCRTSVDDLLKLKAERMPPRGSRLTIDQTAILAYHEELRHAGIVDFDAILSEFLALLEDGPAARTAIGRRFTHFHCDEAQDSAPIDWAIYRALPIAHKFWVGDGDQSIYKFRGASPEDFTAMANAPGTRLIKLEGNYRSRAEICDVANRLIEHNVDRIPKRTLSMKGLGGRVIWPPAITAQHEGEEMSQVAAEISIELTQRNRPPTEIAILCRTNALASAYGRTLAAWKLPVVVRERPNLPRDWPRVRAYIEHIAQPENDTLAFIWLVAAGVGDGMNPVEARRMAGKFQTEAQARGLSIHRYRRDQAETDPRHVQKSMLWASAEAIMMVVERTRGLPPDATMTDLALALAENEEMPSKPTEAGIQVLTCHAAKGLEFDVVFIVGLEDETWPGKRRNTDVEEARRLLFVAVTRARERLYLHHCASRVAKFGKHEEIQARSPSRFLKEMLGGTP